MNDWTRGCAVLPKNNSLLLNNVNMDYLIDFLDIKGVYKVLLRFSDWKWSYLNYKSKQDHPYFFR